MKGTLKVAAVQFDSQWENVQANLDRAAQAVASAQAELVILPEMFATGFSMNSAQIAQPIDGSIVTQMTQLAKTSGKALIFSAAIAADDKYYNRLFFIEPSGKIATYDKRHTFRMANEHKFYSSGNEKLIVEYKGFRICTLICYDLRFPVFSRSRGDYDLLVYVAAWPSVRAYPWAILLRARAIENQCYCIGVNRVGNDPKNHYSGDSVVLDYLGQPMVEARANAEEVVCADLSIDDLREFRLGFPAGMDADNFEITD